MFRGLCSITEDTPSNSNHVMKMDNLQKIKPKLHVSNQFPQRSFRQEFVVHVESVFQQLQYPLLHCMSDQTILRKRKSFGAMSPTSLYNKQQVIGNNPCYALLEITRMTGVPD